MHRRSPTVHTQTWFGIFRHEYGRIHVRSFHGSVTSTGPQQQHHERECGLRGVEPERSSDDEPDGLVGWSLEAGIRQLEPSPTWRTGSPVVMIKSMHRSDDERGVRYR